MKEGGRSDAGTVGIRTRRLLIVCEVALSVVLLMGAGVMLRSLFALRSVDAGSIPQRPDHACGAARGALQDASADDAFYNAVLQRLRALPGVQKRPRSTICRWAAGRSSRW